MNLKITLLICLFFSLNGITLYSQSSRDNQTKKFVYQTSLGIANGLGDVKYGFNTTSNNIPTFKIQQLLAYQFNNYVYMGVGAGIDIWKKNAFIPLFGNISVNFINRKITPHWYMNLGYALKWYVSSQPDISTGIIHATVPGPYGESGLGLKIKFSERLAFVFTANYNVYYSQINYSEVIPGQEDFSNIVTNRYRKTFYHFVGIKLGLLY